jgi:hypothetical protein
MSFGMTPGAARWSGFVVALAGFVAAGAVAVAAGGGAGEISALLLGSAALIAASGPVRSAGTLPLHMRAPGSAGHRAGSGAASAIPGRTLGPGHIGVSGPQLALQPS